MFVQRNHAAPQTTGVAFLIPFRSPESAVGFATSRCMSARAHSGQCKRVFSQRNWRPMPFQQDFTATLIAVAGSARARAALTAVEGAVRVAVAGEVRRYSHPSVSTVLQRTVLHAKEEKKLEMHVRTCNAYRGLQSS